jgi:hypothetical protein
MNGITVLVATIIILVCALPLGLLVAVVQHPWLLLDLFLIVPIFVALKNADGKHRCVPRRAPQRARR